MSALARVTSEAAVAGGGFGQSAATGLNYGAIFDGVSVGGAVNVYAAQVVDTAALLLPSAATPLLG